MSRGSDRQPRHHLADREKPALLSQLGHQAQSGTPIVELAGAAVDYLTSLLRVPCGLVAEMRGGLLAPVASRGWLGPVRASLVHARRPGDGVRVSGAEAAAAGVSRTSVAATQLTVRGRPWGVIAAHAPPGHQVSAEDRDTLGVIAHILATAQETRAAHEELEHLMLHDALTGLPVVSVLVDRLEQILRRRRHDRMLVALVCIDIDRFGDINKTLGHQAGDRILQDLAARLRRAVRTQDTMVRYGGDKLLVLCEGLANEVALLDEAERLRRSVTGVVRAVGRDLLVGASAGVSIARSGVGAEQLLHEADLAMYQAREKGSGQVVTYDAPLHSRLVNRLELETDLRRALAVGEFVLYYQPVVRMADGTATSTEGLVRWSHPTRGLVSPGEFVPVAEDTRLIVPLGEWVLQQACFQARDWADLASRQGLSPPGVSVNLSARQISEPDLIAQVRNALRISGLQPGQLTLEITESVVMADAEGAVAVLQKLRDLGVGLSIDDFGTGYSSLNYLKRYPVDSLKIDRSFVAGLGTDPDDSVIVGAIIRLAEALGIRTIAEGVESELQIAELLELGCGLAQGYYYAVPGPPGAITDLLGLNPTL